MAACSLGVQVFKDCVESEPTLRPTSGDVFQRIRDIAVHHGLATPSAAHYTQILVHGSETQSCGSPLNSARTSVFSSPYGRMSSFYHEHSSSRSPRSTDPWSKREGSGHGGLPQRPLLPRRPQPLGSEVQRLPLGMATAICGPRSWQTAQQHGESYMQEEAASARSIVGLNRCDPLSPAAHQAVVVRAPAVLRHLGSRGLSSGNLVAHMPSEVPYSAAETALLPWELHKPRAPQFVSQEHGRAEAATQLEESPSTVGQSTEQCVCVPMQAKKSHEASLDCAYRVHSLLSLVASGLSNNATQPARSNIPFLEGGGSLHVSDSSSSEEPPDEEGDGGHKMRPPSEGQLRLLGSTSSGSLPGRFRHACVASRGSMHSSESFNLELGGSENLAKLLCKLEGSGRGGTSETAALTHSPLTRSCGTPEQLTESPYPPGLPHGALSSGLSTSSELPCSCLNSEACIGVLDSRVKWLNNAMWDPVGCPSSSDSDLHSQGSQLCSKRMLPAVLVPPGSACSASASCTLALPGRHLANPTGSASMSSTGCT
jgi:hypothetical protein